MLALRTAAEVIRVNEYIENALELKYYRDNIILYNKTRCV